MSKAILVMDMPKNCIECPIGKNMSISIETCIQCPFGKCAIDEEAETIPDWCPLRPMPEKKEVCGKYPQPDGITPSYKIGYNACIDEIGGSNETDKETHQSE